jgi:hypothetical protein
MTSEWTSLWDCHSRPGIMILSGSWWIGQPRPHTSSLLTSLSQPKTLEIYLNRIVRLHGIPKTIISGQGPQFIAHFLGTFT